MKLIAFFSCFLLLFACQVEEKDTVFETTDLWTAGSGDYNNYRIPSLIVSTKGTVLAFCEGREGGDSGDINLLLKRSEDHGKTWSKEQVVWDDGANSCGNPCPVLDEETGRIWLFLTWNDGRDHESKIIQKTSRFARLPYVCYSDDDGQSWSVPMDLSSTCRDTSWGWYATGPGIGIQLKSGKYKGRLVIPANHSYDDPDGSISKGPFSYGAHVLFSDDHGKTWEKSQAITPGCNESQVSEMSDGSLVMNMRSYNGPNCRAISRSLDGGKSWSAISHDPQLVESRCQASLLNFGDFEGRNMQLFSNPAVDHGRSQLTIKASFDDCISWNSGKLIHAGPAAYSCLTKLANGQVGIFYEAGVKNPYEKMVFASFDADEIVKEDLPYQEAYFHYTLLPDLPASSGMSIQPGLAGPYAGIENNVLILAGGANFPGKLPWEGGTKVYYQDIFILQKLDTGAYSWSRMDERLPLATGYGGAVSTPLGLFCFGGNTNQQNVDKSWILNYIPESGKMEIKPGPDLPLPLTNFACSLVGNKLYLAGGISENGEAVKRFFSMDISGADPHTWKWDELPAWEGKARAFAVGVTQSNGERDCFYLFSGRNVQHGSDPEILYDAHVYDPLLNTWSQISEGREKMFPFMAGTAFPLGASTIVFTSGASGEMMLKQLELADDQEKLLKHLNSHPGFGQKVLAFNTVTHEIYTVGSLPHSGQVTTSAVRWNDEIFIPSGEIRPGVRTPEVLKISINKNSKKLSTLDIFVIAIYFSILAWMGFFFSRRQKTTSDYFKGGGRIPWWAAGLSVFGTALSAITFMAIPAKTFATDWSYFMLNMTIFLVAPIIVSLFIPFYRKLNVTTAYEYLEVRFNLIVRLLGSLSFILFQVGRMGVVLFLPAIALNVATGVDIFVCIGLMGIVSLIYTMMGGIEAVIWTDVMQVIVLLGGALLCLGLIIFSIDGGMTGILETASSDDKFNVFDLELSLRQPTLWVMLIGGIFANITTYGTDQTMVQRYLTTKTQAEAGKSVWTNAILTIPASLIFFFAGTALFVFYKSFPGELNPGFQSNDAIFPWYIISQLPSGLAGLLIAAIFAAAMSSLSSSMNSAATAYATDIHFRFGWGKGKNQLKIARQATLLIGIVGILFAFLMATMDIKSLWDQFQKVLGLIIGSLGGVFLLGILTKKAHTKGVLIGLFMSIITQIIMALTQAVHLLMYAATGVISCFVFGYLASLLIKKKSTIKTHEISSL